MLDKNTIWNTTYRVRRIDLARDTQICLFAAIYHDENTGQLSLANNLGLEISVNDNRSSSKTKLDPEQMDLLAAHLIEMAEYQRQLADTLRQFDSEQRLQENENNLDQVTA